MYAMQALTASINLGLKSFSSLAWPISRMPITVSGGTSTSDTEPTEEGILRSCPLPPLSHPASADLAVAFDHNYVVEKFIFDLVSCPGFGT
jgi:hypothetical protein